MIKNFDCEMFLDYLNENHHGKDNGIARSELCEKFGISPKDLRKIIKEINENPSYELLISGSHNCYICETPAEEFTALQETANSIIGLIQKLMIMETKCSGKTKFVVSEEVENWVKESFFGEKNEKFCTN